MAFSTSSFERRSRASLRSAAFGRPVRQRGFQKTPIFNGLQPSKMTVALYRTHPVKNCVFQKAASVLLFFVLGGCAATAPQSPYPAFIQVDELPDVFIAGLPGVRAKQLAGNPATRRSSNRILLPPDWQFTTGAAPGKSVELYVLAGEIELGDLTLGPGGYAYVPPGSTGLQMRTAAGAMLLYFIDDADADAAIQTPLILSSDLLGWSPLSENPNDIGISVKELRADPGSGARTWLMKVDSVASQGWQQSSKSREGYLVAGTYRDSECINGEVVTGDYVPGGYFHRVPGATFAGPEAASASGAIWLLRVQETESVQALPECLAAQADPE